MRATVASAASVGQLDPVGRAGPGRAGPGRVGSGRVGSGRSFASASAFPPVPVLPVSVGSVGRSVGPVGWPAVLVRARAWIGFAIQKVIEVESKKKGD